MKRIVFALLVLMVAAPAGAEVLITCEPAVPNEPNIIVGYVNTEGQPVRSFALDITADGRGRIIDVNCVSTDYYLCYVYPTAVEFNDAGEVVNWGLYDVSGQGAAGITVEMAWLYNPNDPDHNTPPADQGDLLNVTVDQDYCTSVEIDENELLGGVVMEDGNSVPATCTGCWVGPIFCMDCDDPDFDMWYSVGAPACWCYDCFDCGDSDGDCMLNFVDVQNFMGGWPPEPHNPCVDFNKDGQITFEDLNVIITNWPPNGACANCGTCTPIP
jgi:hypothetical protein